MRARKEALSLVHNIDAGLSVKTASKAPLYAGADAGIEISSIPASASSVSVQRQRPASASSVSVERQYCEPGLSRLGRVYIPVSDKRVNPTLEDTFRVRERFNFGFDNANRTEKTS